MEKAGRYKPRRRSQSAAAALILCFFIVSFLDTRSLLYFIFIIFFVLYFLPFPFFSLYPRRHLFDDRFFLDTHTERHCDINSANMFRLLYYGALVLSAGVVRGGSASYPGSCLEPDLIQDSSAFSGQEPGTEGIEPGQAPSATDANNFINFCHGQELTNGKINAAGSCNGIPMGRLPSVDNMISAIITNPKHAARIPAYTNFVVSVQTTHLSAGYFVNPATNYYTAPQDLDSNGDILGHCHIAIQDIGSFQSSTPPDPREFVFFSGILDSGDGHGLLYATVEGGLPPGAYRVCTMIAASNHQPVVMPVPQRGAQDDCTKFEVVDVLHPGNPEIPIVGNPPIGKKCRRRSKQ